MSESKQNVEGIDIEENKQDLVEEQDGIGSQPSENSRFSDDFHSDEECEIGEKIRPEVDNAISICQIKNPVSAYMVFVKSWKQAHSEEKLNISMMGEIWKQLSPAEKSGYEEKYKEKKREYDAYVAYMQTENPGFGKKNYSSKKHFFPLHRVKAIMKLDSFYTTTTENITTMTMAVEYFGEYFLEEVKKISEGKKRIDAQDCFEAINSNQTNLWFLKCLIDEHNNEFDANKRAQCEIRKEKKEQQIESAKGQLKHPKQRQIKKKESSLPKGQLRLTDMF